MSLQPRAVGKGADAGRAPPSGRDPVRVSDLVHYLLCPRIVFYERRGLKYEPKTDPARAARKEEALLRPGSELAPAHQIRPLLESPRLGLRGEPDKTFLREGVEAPALVRPSEPPSSGAWRSDRVALAAYALLLEGLQGKAVAAGLIEYVGGEPVAREVRITPYDRRLVAALVERIRRMGPRRPGRPWRAPCRSCNFYALCFPRGRRLF